MLSYLLSSVCSHLDGLCGRDYLIRTRERERERKNKSDFWRNNLYVFKKINEMHDWFVDASCENALF